jgi:RHS repeat-associated protein
VSESTRQRFTSKERDSESGLDYFLARYYSSAQGRFTSSDRPFADQSEDNPQSWNLYFYVGNNPLTYSDPFGLWKRHVIDGKVYWEAEPGDGYETLSKATGQDENNLKDFFDKATFRVGELVDLTGFDEQYPVRFEFVQIVRPEDVPKDKYRIEINPRLPIPGGKVGAIINRVNKSAGGKWVEIRQTARDLANAILKEAKDARVGAGARSGQHGKPYTAAAAKLREMLNKHGKDWIPEFKEELEKKIKDWESKAKTISHK